MVFGESYDCIYQANGYVGDSLNNLKEKFSIALGHYSCFSAVYSAIKGYGFADIIYSLYLFKEDLPGKNFNLCTYLETKKILRCLQKTVPFTYKFSTATYKKASYSTEKVDFNVLTFRIKGNYAQHLWVTSMLRCFFEWPYNIAAKEACKLQSEIKEIEGIDLEKENWINLYLTIVAQLGSYSLHGVVDLRKHPKPRTYHEWYQKLASIKGCPSIIETLRDGGTFNKSIKRIEIYNQETYDQGVQSRASKYIAAYKDKLSWKK